MPIDPKLFNALGGGQAQVPQQPAPAPAGSPAPGAGPSLFQALGEQPMHQMGAQPLQMGPMIAAGPGIPEQDKPGSKDLQDMSILERIKAAAAGIDPYTGKPKK